MFTPTAIEGGVALRLVYAACYALSIWYGEDVGRVLVERQARTARNYKRALIGLGLGFALLVMLSAIRVIK